MDLRSREFGSGAELLEDGRFNETACFLLDVHMPEMDGYELAARLVELRPESPIIFITARSEESERWRQGRPTAVALLLKPFSERELIAALERAMGSGPFSFSASDLDAAPPGD